MTTVTAWHTRLETATSVMMDGLHIWDIKVTPKEIHSKWHLCITKGQWLHIIDFICSSSEIWHAADSSAEIVKFYTTQNVLWRMMDREGQIFGKRPRCALNSHRTFYFTGLSCISGNGLGGFRKKTNTDITACDVGGEKKVVKCWSDTVWHVYAWALLLL